MITNKFKTYTYKINGLSVGATSQRSNFNAAKLRMAINQSLSLWTAYSPLRFVESTAVETDFDISFIKQSGESAEIGVTIFGRSIEINVTNRLFIDKFNEPEYPGSTWGPWDLIRALCHEVGHVLGLNHPPRDNMNNEMFPGSMMSSSFGEKQVVRTLSPYDISIVQQQHGVISLEPQITTSLQNGSQINTTFPGLHFIKDSWGIQLDGPVGNALSLYVFMPETKGKKISSVILDYNTYTANTLVHSVEMYDGLIPIQEFYLSSGLSKYGDVGFKEWVFTMGILDKKKIKNGILLKINLEFRNVTATHDVGVFQLLSAKATSLFELVVADFPNIKKLAVKK